MLYKFSIYIKAILFYNLSFMEAAIYSNQGDEYQRLIALHWVVCLLYDDNLEWVQIEAIANPIDDIVIRYKDVHTAYVQAKKNQPNYRAWGLTDLREILNSAKNQSLKDGNGLVLLYSRTPFGQLNELVEATNLYERFTEFQDNASANVQKIFTQFCSITKTTDDEAFKLIKTIRIKEHHDFEGWESTIKNDLKRLFASHERVYDTLMSLIIKQSSRLGVVHKFNREYILKYLNNKGLYQAPLLEESEIVGQLKKASQIGRNHDMEIGHLRINRPEVETILDEIDKNTKSILVKGKKGSGKSWVLLTLADHLDKDESVGLLFIKGDQFDDIATIDDLSQRLQFSHDPLILLSRLADFRKVVVIIDSLDALALARDQTPLKLFLNLVDKLLTIENINIVFSCRDFDLDYDPYLRVRHWDFKLPVPSFNFEKDVQPILEKWGIDFHNINDDQKALLSHPQNLKLFERIHDKIPASSLLTEFQIVKLFFEEIVENKQTLGLEAIKSLEAMAVTLNKNRRLFMPKMQFTGSGEIVRILSSEGILNIDTLRDRLSFSHQTLLDYLSVRSFIKENKTLLNFIISQPQLPFIRPAIRCFVFYLHLLDNKRFSAEIIRIFDDQRVAYHIKRLIVESLSEISPVTEVELELAKKIYRNHPDLFVRFLSRVTSLSWFDAMHPAITSVIINEDKENKWIQVTFLYSLQKWMNDRPDNIVECWKMVLNRPEPQYGPILSIIDKFTKWESAGIREIIDKLFDLDKNHFDDKLMGRVISQYIDATNKGDELLWQFVTQNVPEGTLTYSFFSSHDGGLICSEHDFHRKGFLAERLKKSTTLLESAINSLLEWSSRYEFRSNPDQFKTSFLSYTSWKELREMHDINVLDPMHELCNAIHRAFIFHAENQSEWFLNYEPNIRETNEAVLAYFLIFSYLTKPQEYADRAYRFILRSEILYEDDLSHELRKILKTMMPYLSSDSQETLQRKVLERIFPDENDADRSYLMHRWKYRMLCVIPNIFLLPVANEFIEKWKDTYGPCLSPPRIRGWGGQVLSPISVDEMEKLSFPGLIKLFNFYNDKTVAIWWGDGLDRNKGGIEQLARVFSDCVAIDPMRYCKYMNSFHEEGISQQYVYSLLEGVSKHLRYRFGKLQKPEGIEFMTPLPDGDELLQIILSWFDRYPELASNGNIVSEALCVIAFVVEKHDLQARLIDYFDKLSKHPDPDKIEQKVFSQGKTEMDESDIVHIGLNSVRGRIAEGVRILIGRLLDSDKKVPDKLLKLLDNLSIDPVEAVRYHVIDFLPYLEYKIPEKGWSLFNNIFENIHPAMWPFAYRFLYHQYRPNFERVLSVLNQIKAAGLQHGAEAWGLISSLCVLDDSILLDILLDQLVQINRVDAWKGARKVFVSNMNDSTLRTKCLKSLNVIAQNNQFPNELFDGLGDVFDNLPLSKDVDANIFIDLYISKVCTINGPIHYISHFFDYLSKVADTSPEWCLEITEKFFQNLQENNQSFKWHSEGLISAAIQMLRWADLEDKTDLIERVIKIQDRLLELEWSGIEEAILRAERE